MKSMLRTSLRRKERGRPSRFFRLSGRYHRAMGRLSRHFTRHLRGVTLLVFLPMWAVAQHPHQHGVLELNLALEERILFVETRWSLLDIAGFEHWPPSDDAEQSSFDRAVGVLSDTRSVFSLPPRAKCKIKDVETTGPEQTDSPDAEADFEEDGLVGAESRTHVGVTVSYRFKCKSPDDLSEIRLHLFRLFPDLQSVQANLITESAQTFQELTFAEPVLFLLR